MVRNTVEETLNGMLDAEADRRFNAEKYQRNDARPIHGQATPTQTPHQGRGSNARYVEAAAADI